MNTWIAAWNTDRSEFSTKLFASYHKMDFQGVTVFFCRDGRFVNDQLFSSSCGELIISDGVLLNLAELKEKYNAAPLEHLIELLKAEKGELFFSAFAGPFCGFRVNSFGDIYAWGNQTGDAPIFYYNGEKFSCVSNDFNLIFTLLKERKIAYHFDENSALQVMTFGFMVDDGTMIEEVKRLQPGRYLKHSDMRFNIDRYHRFSFGREELSFEECVDRIDSGFRAALKRCFDKDLEYGLEHIADMSAGLDTRMVNWVARDMGYNGIVNFHYSQGGSDEALFASAVSKRLDNDFHSYNLDNVRFIYDIDKIVSMNYGLAVFCGITGGEHMLSCINFNKFGLEHTGQLENLSSYGNTDTHVQVQSSAALRYSSTLDCPVSETLAAQYKNNEEFCYYVRGFQGILSTHLTRRHYTYAVAPFIDRDFFEFCSNLPMEFKKDHKLYWAWIDKYYPEAGSYPSSTLRKRSAQQYCFFRAKRKLKSYGRKFSAALGFIQSSSSKNDMNPFEYWYDTKPELRDFIDRYYQDTRPILDTYPLTADRIDILIRSSRVMDKMLALTVLGAAKAYFGDNN